MEDPASRTWDFQWGARLCKQACGPSSFSARPAGPMGPELRGFHLGVNEPFDFPHEVCQEERFQSNIQARGWPAFCITVVSV